MKRLALFLAPPLVILVLNLFLAFGPAAATIAASPGWHTAPYIILAISVTLGALFAQSRISFLGLYLIVLFFLLDRFAYVRPQPDKFATVVFLAGIYSPLLFALFFHATEHRIVGRQGLFRILIVMSTVLIMALLPQIPAIAHGMARTQVPLLSPAASWLNIPLVGLLVLAGAAVALLTPNRKESPLLGPLLLVALLFLFAGLNGAAPVWQRRQGAALAPFFTSGAALVMVAAVLESLWRTAHLDELTQLASRRVLKRHLAAISPPYCIAVVDIDHFKKINDRYGHATGDQVLRYVAGTLRATSAGRCYRFGGEEFMIVAEDAAPDTFVQAMEDLRHTIETKQFVLRSRNRPAQKPESPTPDPNPDYSERLIPVTVSIGIARSSDRCPHPDDVVTAADKALYRAKRTGRNRVHVAR